jgi:hypothetical protein
MLATDFKLISQAALHRFEEIVWHRLDAVPFSYRRILMDEAEIRYSFVNYLLLTYWPELLQNEDTELAADELLYNRLYWLLRLSTLYRATHDSPGGFEQHAAQLMDLAEREFGRAGVQEIEAKVLAEIATNEKEIAVAFSDFSIGKVKRQFGLQLDETGDFFADVAPVPLSSLLQETLRDHLPLALAIGTEKARSEFIIAPVLAEVRRRFANAISLFSGVEWDVDAAQGLRGVCDFVLSMSPEQLVIEAPVVSVVEAKKEDITGGIGQCLAEMVAARIFNQQNDNAIPVIYGIVTTGSNWKFLRLVETTAYIDVTEYHIKEADRIVGIIVSMFPKGGTLA